LPPIDFDFFDIALSSVPIANAIPTLIYHDYIVINSISYLVAKEYSKLNDVSFAVL
jgi:hypothetical protein